MELILCNHQETMAWRFFIIRAGVANPAFLCAKEKCLVLLVPSIYILLGYR